MSGIEPSAAELTAQADELDRSARIAAENGMFETGASLRNRAAGIRQAVEELSRGSTRERATARAAGRAVLKAIAAELAQGEREKRVTASECRRGSSLRARFEAEADLLKRERKYALKAGRKAIARMNP